MHSEVLEKHENFVRLILDGLDKIEAYRKVYPRVSAETARTQSHKLLQKAHVAAMIEKGKRELNALAMQKAAEKLADQIVYRTLSIAQKRDMLYKIVMGEHRNEIKKPVFNPITRAFQIVTVEEKPDHVGILKAIEVDNKMSGDEKPPDGNPSNVLVFNDAQVNMILQKLNA